MSVTRPAYARVRGDHSAASRRAAPIAWAVVRTEKDPIRTREDRRSPPAGLVPPVSRRGSYERTAPAPMGLASV
ncbi:hypothetical protein GCM10009806_03200 [Microbacterium flavum]